jgi:hypothetical protein
MADVRTDACVIDLTSEPAVQAPQWPGLRQVEIANYLWEKDLRTVA